MMEIHVIRLRPGQDVRNELDSLCKELRISAGVILTAVGSLQKAKIRLAQNASTNANEIADLTEELLEIVSLTGTMNFEHGMHVHVAVADANGEVCGGHLLEGCEVFTTCEIVIGDAKAWEFQRHGDVNTGHRELVTKKKVVRRELDFITEVEEEGYATPTGGKKARRLRQMRMMERERAAMNGETRRGLLARIGAIIVPPPTPARTTMPEIASEV